MRASRSPSRPRRSHPEVPAGDPSEGLAHARDCYGRRAWTEAHRQFAAIEGRSQIPLPDLELYAWSAGLSGKDADFLRLLEKLYQRHLEAGDEARAARAAFWAGMRLGAMREIGRAGGWLARAQRLADRRDCVERGYLLLPITFRHLAAGQHDAAHATARTAVEIGERFVDADLCAFARCLQGCALLRQGQIEKGLAFLDEAMVAVATGGLAPLPTGLIYCNAIASCNLAWVMDRAREWTAALSGWCAAQPQLVPFNGRCLVHRAELMQFFGDWTEAIEEARRAAERSRVVDPETAAESSYQEAEVHRLRGDIAAAERSYRGANQLGREAQPGLALLRLAQGRGAAALSAIRRVLAATGDRLQRARLLPAVVEIALGAGDIDEARRGCDELEQIAAAFDSEVLGAMAAHARGAVALADGHAEAALEPLRRAFRIWHDLGAPYIAARVRVLLARACRALGDADTATLETDLAREVFARLGAAPDLAALRATGARGGAAGDSCGLSPRELEVLRLVAAGKTNKVIAKQLFLSEKTIDRHVSNIFVKTDVPSRAAATAYAYQHGLV